jgi:predicted RNase H-like nuclease (RuvC/YqgF family)
MAKGLLSKLGLVEEDVQVAPKKATAAAPTPQPTYSSSYEPTPAADPAIADMLSKSLKDSQLSGFDYMKFVSAVEAMKSTGTSEDARFKMAYFTAQQMGVDKQDLLKSGSHYLDVLKEDETDFEADCSNFEKAEIDARQDQIQKIEEQINDLANKLAHAQQDHERLQQESKDAKTQLDARRGSFAATVKTIRSVIESNIAKINQYIQ